LIIRDERTDGRRDKGAMISTRRSSLNISPTYCGTLVTHCGTQPF